MKLDFDIETQGSNLDFDLKDTTVVAVGGGGGVSESRVIQLIGQETADLQPKTDEMLETKSKEVVGAINEVNESLVKDIGAEIDESTNVLTVELKDKNGNVIASTEVVVPIGKTPDLTEYVKFTDYPDTTKAGVIKTPYGNTASALYRDGHGNLLLGNTKELISQRSGQRAIRNIDFDYAIRKGITTNTETLTDEEKASACDWIGSAVKPTNIINTDGVYAKKSDGTVVWAPIDAGNGLTIISNGHMIISGATQAIIDEREKGDTKAWRKPICPNMLDYAVKSVLTKPLVEMTDEEKEIACEWLGVTDLIAELRAEIEALKNK